MDKVKTSKFMSYVLRHDPKSIGLELDAEGWASVDELIRLSQHSKCPLSLDLIVDVVRSSDKQRFKLSEDSLLIRANQGHSISIDLALAPQQPPRVLYHGTAERFVDSILQKGLIRGPRQHVHLSRDRQTAETVGRRHGKPTVFVVNAEEMFFAGYLFFLSDNGVWLTEHVPSQFLSRNNSASTP